MSIPQIVLFTDFSHNGPYVGQMKSVINHYAPNVTIIDLMHDVPAHDIKAGAYLLGSLCNRFPNGTIFLAVVDPGVGSDQREPVVVKAKGRWFVGPGNGIFSIAALEDQQASAWQISWHPKNVSASFHGRDIFAPIAAQIALGHEWLANPCPLEKAVHICWPLDFGEIIYIDDFGNCMTGFRAGRISMNSLLEVADHKLRRAVTFSDVKVGQTMWFENSIGLAEIAVNCGRADNKLSLKIGSKVKLISVD